MITINDDDLPITVAEKLITGTKEETTGFLSLHVDMFTQEDLREIAKYLFTYDLCHPNGD